MSFSNSSSPNFSALVLTFYIVEKTIERKEWLSQKRVWKRLQRLHGQLNHGKEGMFMPNEVFKNNSNDFISNTWLGQDWGQP